MEGEHTETGEYEGTRVVLGDAVTVPWELPHVPVISAFFFTHTIVVTCGLLITTVLRTVRTPSSQVLYCTCATGCYSYSTRVQVL
jgi:hypothetical protein